MSEFKGTPGVWKYKKPTSNFDSCTISENGKIIGYTARDSQEDRANELLRSKAPEMLEELKYAVKALKAVHSFGATSKIIERWEKLIKESTEV